MHRSGENLAVAIDEKPVKHVRFQL